MGLDFLFADSKSFYSYCYYLSIGVLANEITVSRNSVKEHFLTPSANNVFNPIDF